jgi:hypothetical protein
MIVATLASVSLVVAVAIEPPAPTPQSGRSMSMQQKTAVMRPLIRSATDCVVRRVSANPRFKSSNVTELIVDAMTPCAPAMRAMIDEYDRLFGTGAGEAFFMGPYLDGLPTTVLKLVKDSIGSTTEPTNK